MAGWSTILAKIYVCKIKIIHKLNSNQIKIKSNLLAANETKASI